MLAHFAAVSAQMREELHGVAAAMRHPTMKGASAEEIIRAFLRKYLPGRYRIAQGKIVDFNGRESRQIDVILVDAARTVPLFADAANIVVPIESVFGVIEVKTRLDARGLRDATQHALAIHGLKIPRRYDFVRGGVVAEFKGPLAYPKVFVLGMSESTARTVNKLGEQYVQFVRTSGIRFPLISCCAILGTGYFIDVPEEHAPGSRVYMQSEAAGDTLLGFLLNVVKALDEMEDRTLPPFELYVNLFGKKLSSQSLAAEAPNQRLQAAPSRTGAPRLKRRR